MADDRAELQRLREIDRIAELEAKASGNARAPLPEEEGLQSTSIPGMGKGGIFGTVVDALGGSSNAVARGFANKASLGNIQPPEMQNDEKQFPLSSTAGKGAGIASTAIATGSPVAAMESGAGRIGASALANGAQGFLQKPEGEDTLSSRAKNGGVSAIIGGLLQAGGEGISKLIGKGAKHAQDFRDIKSGAMADRATDAIDEAASAINSKQISPRDEQLRELIKGKTFEINPDRVKPTFPNLGNKMAEGLEGEGAARSVLSSERALRLKRAADAAADYGASKPFDAAATASGEEAKSLADILRRQINSDPKAAALNEEMGQFSALRDALVKREGTAPIETLQAPLGSSRHAVLAKVDNAAGTNLQGLGQDIKAAKSLELNPSRLLKPLELPSEVKAMSLRGAAELSRTLNKAPQGTKESLINALVPAQRGK